MSERKHLVSAEVEKLIAAVKGSRNAARDRCLLLLMLGEFKQTALMFHRIFPFLFDS